MKMNIFYFSTFILFTFLYSCSSGPANDPRTIYTYQTMQTEMLIPSSKLAENKSTLKEISEDKTEPEIQRWAINALFDISKMEKSAGETLKLIEDAKQLLFLQMGENLKIDDKASIRYEKFDIRFPLYPARYDLSKVKNNETTDVLSPDGTFAKKIQFSIKQLRKVLTETAGFHIDRFTHETLYYFKDPNINTFSSRLDLRKQIEQSNGFKHVALDDQELILRIYEQISYTPEFWETSFGENISWIEAFGFLISLQSNILNATNEAVTCIQYTYGSCGCIDIANFAPLVTGEERILPGQNPKFEVLLAGIMSHKTPIFKVNGAKIIHVHDGVATITAEMGKDQEKTITGTLTIFNKSGIPKTYPWKKTFYREPNK